MARVPVPHYKTPTKAVLIDPNATEGAIVGETLWVRNADNSLSLYDPTTGTAANSTTPAGTTTNAVTPSGSNSGYPAASSPAAAPTNFDLDLSMIAGLGDTAFPTLNYILIGDGTQWVAKPMTGDASIVASGAITLAAGQRRYHGTAAGTNTYTSTVSPTASGFSSGDLYTITFTNANTGASTLNGKAIQYDGAALVTGQIPAGSTFNLLYDGTQFQIVGTALSLTTTGTSGAATLSGGVLNIPQYSAGGGSAGGPGAVYFA